MMDLAVLAPFAPAVGTVHARINKDYDGRHNTGKPAIIIPGHWLGC